MYICQLFHKIKMHMLLQKDMHISNQCLIYMYMHQKINYQLLLINNYYYPSLISCVFFCRLELVYGPVSRIIWPTTVVSISKPFPIQVVVLCMPLYAIRVLFQANKEKRKSNMQLMLLIQPYREYLPFKTPKINKKNNIYL